MTPTLAEFAAAFEKLWQRYPEAPRLPKGCNLYHITDDETQMGIPDVFGHCLHNEHPAALALCCVTAMEIGAWWERKSIGRGVSVKATHDGWVVYVFAPEIPWPPKEWLSHPSLPSACLAALVAMGGGS